MGLGQSRHRYRDPRYPHDFPQFQQPTQPFIPGYMPYGYPQPAPVQPVYPHHPGFLPPVYGQGAALPPQQLHYFPEDTQRRRKSRRPARADTFVGGFVQDQQEGAPRRHTSRRPREPPVVPERNETRRAPTPFIPRRPGPEEEDEEEEEIDRTRGVPTERERRQSPVHYEQPPATFRGDISAILPMPPANRSAYGPPGSRPPVPLKNPLPPPPRDLYEMSPYKSLLTLPQTTALLTATLGPQLGTVVPLASTEPIKRKNTLFRAFSRKDKKPQPKPQAEQNNPFFIPVFIPPSSQQPLNQPPDLSSRQNEAPSQAPSQRRPFAGAGPRDAPISESTSAGTYQPQDDSSSVSSEAVSPPIPPHPTNPPTIKFDQSRSYTPFMNHSPHRVMWEGLPYPTALHLHEALKFLGHRPDIAEQIRRCGSVHEVYPLTAKYVELQRPDWGEQFLPLMYEVLFAKFRQHPDLRVMLLGTGNADLEYADAVDDYWGSGADGQGANQLGKVLTRVRERLREDSTP